MIRNLEKFNNVMKSMYYSKKVRQFMKKSKVQFILQLLIIMIKIENKIKL